MSQDCPSLSTLTYVPNPIRPLLTKIVAESIEEKARELKIYCEALLFSLNDKF